MPAMLSPNYAEMNSTGSDGATIRFAVANASLGYVVVAATELGICFIALGDHPDALEKELRHRFPRASFIAGQKQFQQTVARVVALVENPSVSLDLPLHVQGTVFQQKVWQALQKIPAGKTRSYSQIARQIGHPTATRAVAGACAANHLAVVIPCHRVVKTNGSLSGYRWGTARKQTLLDREQSSNSKPVSDSHS